MKPALIRGGRPLLFERLCEERFSDASDPDSETSPAAQRGYEIEQLARSVMRELSNLLNTRLPVAAGHGDESTQTVINYGLPDFSGLNTSSPGDRAMLELLIARKIEGFEPRLRDVRVALEPHPEARGILVGYFQGRLRTEWVSEAVSFPLSLGTFGAEIAPPDHAR